MLMLISTNTKSDGKRYLRILECGTSNYREVAWDDVEKTMQLGLTTIKGLRINNEDKLEIVREDMGITDKVITRRNADVSKHEPKSSERLKEPAMYVIVDRVEIEAGEHQVRRDISVRLYVAGTPKANEEFKKFNEELAKVTGVTLTAANRSVKKQSKGTMLRGKVAEVISSKLQVYYTNDTIVQYDNSCSGIHYSVDIDTKMISGNPVENWNCGSYSCFQSLGGMLKSMRERKIPNNFILCK